MPWSCAYWSASQICGTMASASARGDPSRVHQLAQAHSVHVLHQEVEQAVGTAKVVDRNDARMIEPGQGFGLAGEPFGEGRHHSRCRWAGFSRLRCDRVPSGAPYRRRPCRPGQSGRATQAGERAVRVRQREAGWSPPPLPRRLGRFPARGSGHPGSAGKVLPGRWRAPRHRIWGTALFRSSSAG